MLTIKLKKDEERRMKTGHLWIFSNEIDSVEGRYEPGAIAEVYSAIGKFIGMGYYNRSSLIACRILTHRKQEIGSTFLARRLKVALEQRLDWYPGETAYRLIFSEGDLLPGFVVDRFGEHVTVQTSTAGAEKLLGPFLDALRTVVEPKSIVLRNDAPARELEGLEPYTKVVHGKVEGPVEIVCDGLRYRVDLTGGQKTGFYFDQRDNRIVGGKLATGKRVLDAFCYTGSWALTAAKASAQSVTGVDSSGPAIELARQNAALNAFARVEFEQADVNEFLDRAAQEGRKYDVIFLDPPPFARSKKDLKEALLGYERLNRRALNLLEVGGYLISSSCSFHVQPDDFARSLVRAASIAGKTLRLIEWRGQSKDHPAILSMPETRYLKCVVTQVA